MVLGIEEIVLTEAIAEDVVFSGEVFEQLTFLAHPGLSILRNCRKIILKQERDPAVSYNKWVAD